MTQEKLTDCIYLTYNWLTKQKECFLGKTCLTDSTACGDYEPEGEMWE